MIPATHRLKHDKDFGRVFKTGRWIGGGLVTLKYAKNDDGDAPKIGFMVGTKVSKSAVRRNGARRRMREVVRLMLKSGKIPDQFDFIVIGNKEIVGKSYHEIEEDIKFSLKKAKILK
ncbi:MAG: ribonuclease P protein component [Patescibacteria group bacterium]|mgnify:CR=1 FL=1